MTVTAEGIWQHFKFSVRRIKISLALIFIISIYDLSPILEKKLKDGMCYSLLQKITWYCNRFNRVFKQISKLEN